MEETATKLPARTTSPRTITAPFTVIVDTREQLAFAFDTLRTDAAQGRKPLVVPCERRTLQSGDYSIVGHENAIAIERKSIFDLFNTISQGRNRFTRELERLNEMRIAYVVIEAEWSEILFNPPRHSQLPPKNVYRSILAWEQRFPRVHWKTCINRDHAEVTTFRILERFWRDQVRDQAKAAAAINGVTHG